MNRYFKAFIFTLCLYGLGIVGFIYFETPKKVVLDNHEQLLTVSHLSFVEQKEVVRKKTVVKPIKPKQQRVQKEKIVTQKKSKVAVKKVQKPKKPPKKRVIVRKKITPKKTVVKKEEPKKEETKEVVKENLNTPQVKQKIARNSYEQAYTQENLKRIIALIQKKMHYPKRARMLKIQGKVIIEFTLNTKGEVSEFKSILGHRFLQRSTIQAIKDASKNFPKVKKQLRLKVPVVYTLS